VYLFGNYVALLSLGSWNQETLNRHKAIFCCPEMLLGMQGVPRRKTKSRPAMGGFGIDISLR
jgi:uncharacterized protein YbbK (DUF523 family)